MCVVEYLVVLRVGRNGTVAKGPRKEWALLASILMRVHIQIHAFANCVDCC